MKMKKIILTSLIIMITNSVFAYEDSATVKKIEPQYSLINQPREVCRDEIIQEPINQQYQQQGTNYGGTILGGLAGGILGNQIGGGNGKTIATAAGAVVGAMVGDNLSNRNTQQYQPQIISRQIHMCHMEDNMIHVLSGYNIEYVYNGKIFNTVLQEKPMSNKIKVDVQVQPILY